MEEESDRDNSARTGQQPSESIGSTKEVLETSASSLKTFIEPLKAAEETPNEYDGGLFKHWIYTDGDVCNAREGVLIAEFLKKVTVGSGCPIRSWILICSECDPRSLRGIGERVRRV
jgi:hypothetical protein